MTFFLLPQTISNAVYEPFTLPMSLSLSDYVDTMNRVDYNPIHTSYTPKTSHFFIMAELIQLHKLSFTTSLHFGSTSCLEYLTYIGKKGTHIDDGASGYYSLIVNDGAFNLSILSYQEPHGCFISKIENSTTAESIQYLFKLCSSYKHVYLCKPESENQTSSVKYVIAIDFLHLPDKENLKLPYYFRMKLEDINSVFGQTQLEHLRFMEYSKIKSLDWCLKYSIPI
jgi:hypothetical protein